MSDPVLELAQRGQSLAPNERERLVVNDGQEPFFSDGEQRFRKAATTAFQRSSEFPLPGKPGVANTRRILVEGFPFAVVVIADDTEIVVHAVAHLSREPEYWLGRLPSNSS